MLSNFALYTTFDVSKLSKIRTNPPEITSETTLWSSGENLGTVLHELFTRYDYRPVAERFREFLKVAYPFVEDIFPETGYGTPARILVRVREKGMRRSMETWDLSDGMLRFLCLTASLLNPYPPSLILIDEPEVGLHPRLLPVIADLIKTASERTQVFITTHSPELLNSFSIEEIAVLTRDENRAGWHRPADRKSLVTLLESAMGPTLGDMHKSGELEAIE
jgi:predicted ATPase